MLVRPRGVAVTLLPEVHRCVPSRPQDGMPSSTAIGGSAAPHAAWAGALVAGLFAAVLQGQNLLFLGDLTTGSAGSDPRDVHAAWTFTLFAAKGPTGREGLYRSDGTPAGTVRLRDVAQVRSPALTPDGRVLFAADSVQGLELWVTDGTAVGTVPLVDIRPGPASSDPDQLTWHEAMRVLVFAADDGVHGRELWLTDGTATGTRLLADIDPGAQGSSPGSSRPWPTAASSSSPTTACTGASRGSWTARRRASCWTCTPPRA